LASGTRNERVSESEDGQNRQRERERESKKRGRRRTRENDDIGAMLCKVKEEPGQEGGGGRTGEHQRRKGGREGRGVKSA